MSQVNNITVIILTFNEESNLPDCLKSLKGIGVNIFVVDSYSTDNTVYLLDEQKINYLQHPFENYARQRNWAQANNPFHTEWVFHLDAGERMTPELVTWLKNDFDPEANVNGYMFSRKTLFFGKWIRHGGHYPNYHLRLFRHKKGHCEAKVYDQHFVCQGKVQVVEKGIDIIDTVAENLKDFTNSHVRWAMFEAVEILAEQKRTGEVNARLFGSPIERRRWLKNNVFQKSPLFLRSFLYFFYRYFLKRGFMDSSVGLVFHILQGFWFRFMVDAMILEIRLKMKKEKKSLYDIIKAYYDPKLLRLLE